MVVNPLVSDIGNYAIWFFVVTSIAAMGLNLTVKEIIAPWKKKGLLSISLIANFVAVPLFALLILRIFPLDTGLATGLLIVAAAAGAPSLPKAISIMKGDVAYAVGLTMILILATIMYMPAVLPFMIGSVAIDKTNTILYLIVFMLIPLIITMALRARLPEMAKRIHPLISRTSDLSIILVLLIYTFILFTSDFTVKAGAVLGLQGVLVAILFILGSFGIGHLMAGRESGSREVLSFGTGFRNISAALVVVTANFRDPQIMFMVLVIAIFGIIFMMLFGGLIFQKKRKNKKKTLSRTTSAIRP
ncbi:MULTISPECIES: bile acid:sodium symporter family protein [Methanocalculus]|uniref:bile acid:sodium symporter family protein n=1 Tax=Methanocalculus TaxID=71151 RepID=UPI00209CB6C4|nr:BASS family bile acid:Na+ symporter [Methanocalculus sp. AMF5]